MATGKKKSYTLSEALGHLDNLKVSSSDESEDDDISANFYSASCKLQ